MSNTTRKIVAGLLGVAMVLTLVVGLSATANAAYTRNLTVGSRGADVTELQTFLAAKGFLNVEPTGYFGSLTKRALAQYQASVGITPAAGYFGPITRAQLATAGGVTPPVSNVPGCPAGAVYNYMTGLPCAGTQTPSTSTSEGTLTVTQSATPANQTNIRSYSDVQVYGLDLRAQLADVTVNRLDLRVAVTASGAQNPGNFINAIKVWNGSTLVKSWSVGTGDFVEGTTAGTYYVRLSNINFVVPKDTTKTLTVSLSTNSGIDVARTVTISGYGSNSLLAVSGNSVNSYYDVSGISRTHVFQIPGTATLTVAADSANPIASTYRVNTTADGAQNVTLLKFNVHPETGDVRIKTVTGIATSTITAPTALYLYDGSTLIQSTTTASTTGAQTFVFDIPGSGLLVTKDSYRTLTVSADMPAATANGSQVTARVSQVDYKLPNDTYGTPITTIVAGNSHTFYGVVSQISLLSQSVSAIAAQNATNTARLEGTLSLKIRPIGGSQTLPTASDFGVTVGTTTSASSTVTNVGFRVIAANGQEVTSGTLSPDTDYTVELKPVVENASLSASGHYSFYVGRYTWTIGSTNQVQTTGLDTIKTGSAYFAK